MTKLNRLLSCDKENMSIHNVKFYLLFRNEKIKAFSKNTHDDIIWILGDSKVSKLIS